MIGILIFQSNNPREFKKMTKKTAGELNYDEN